MVAVEAEEDDFGDSGDEFGSNEEEQMSQDTRRVENQVTVRTGINQQRDENAESEIEFFNLRRNELNPEIEFSNVDVNLVIVEQLKCGGIDIQSMVNQLVEKQVKETIGKLYDKGINRNNGSNIVKRTPEKLPPRPGCETVAPIKSPSDTTLYAPLLNKGSSKGKEIIDQISNFVESVRLNHKEKERRFESRRPSPHRQGEATPTTSRRDDGRKGHQRELKDSFGEMIQEEWKRVSNVKSVADKIILEAEKFKASVQAPQGMVNSLFNIVQFFDNDDDFFHVTCHIDPVLKDKIEKGEFVELERLIPKTRPGQTQFSEGRMEWISRDGMTFLAPVQEKDTKINGIRRWEQAFRVYAAIYTRANPNRASEIWEYVYTINTAAASYHWHNVAYYDYTFRQLMSEKLWRSWSKTYTQGWNLAFKDPINKSAGYSGSAGNNQGGSSKHLNNTGKRRDWRDDCCWRYNKNRCKKNADNCHFDHRCTYCGGWNHRFYNCRKQLQNETGHHRRPGQFEDDEFHRRSGSISPNRSPKDKHAKYNPKK